MTLTVGHIEVRNYFILPATNFQLAEVKILAEHKCAEFGCSDSRSASSSKFLTPVRV